MTYVVLGFMRNDKHDVRVRCATPGLAAAEVERLLREGYLWIHIDNTPELARLRTGLDEHGDALPPLDV